METRRTHEQCRAELTEMLELERGESLDAILARALPVIGVLNPRWRLALEMRYGLEDYEPSSLREVAKAFSIRSNGSIHTLLQNPIRTLHEVLGTMRKEKEFLGRFDSWEAREFFTYERGLWADVDVWTVNRWHNILAHIYEPELSMGDFRADASEQRLMQFPNCGKKIVDGVKAMLATGNIPLRVTG